MSVYGEMAAGAGLNAGLGVINNIIAAKREEKAREQNFKYNEMAAENAQKRTEAFYNQYQSPEALLRQYKEAGLSPSLMFGGSGAGGGATPADGAQGNGISGVNPTTYGIDALQGAQLALLNAQTRKTNAEADTEEGANEMGASKIAVNLAEAGYKRSAEQYTRLETAIKNVEKEILDATKQEQIETIKQNAEYAEAQAVQMYWASENEHIKFEYNNEVYETEVNKAKEQLKEIQKHILLMQSEKEVNEQQALKIVMETETIFGEYINDCKRLLLEQSDNQRKWSELKQNVLNFKEKLKLEYNKLGIDIKMFGVEKDQQTAFKVIDIVTSIAQALTFGALMKGGKPKSQTTVRKGNKTRTTFEYE